MAVQKVTKKTEKKPAAGGAKKAVAFTADTKPAAVPKGVVAAKKPAALKKAAPAAKKAAPKKKAAPVAAVAVSKGKKNTNSSSNGKKAAPVVAQESDSDSDSDDDASSVNSSDMSSEDGADRTMAVEFRFLPSQFQEPELRLYLSQFGSPVNKAVCLRHKDSDSSRGIALVTWKDEGIINTVLEDCNGMLLGGRTVRCRRVFLKRDLPAARIVSRRHEADIRRRTRGSKMTRFVNKKHQDTVTGLKAPQVAEPAAEKVVKTKDIVGALIKYSNREKEHNKALKTMGINYSFNGFSNQYKQVPKSQIVTKKEMRAKRNRDAAEGADE